MFKWSKSIEIERLLGCLTAQPMMKADDFFVAKIPKTILTDSEDSQLIHCTIWYWLLPLKTHYINHMESPKGKPQSFKSYIIGTTKEQNRRDYETYKKGWAVADLTQLVRTGRGRTNTCEGHLPTLTTNSGRLWSKVLNLQTSQIITTSCISVQTILDLEYGSEKMSFKISFNCSLSNLLPLFEAHQRILSPLEMLASHAMPVTAAHSRSSGTPKLQVGGCTDANLVKAAGNAMSIPCVGAFLLACIFCIEHRWTNSLMLFQNKTFWWNSNAFDRTNSYESVKQVVCSLSSYDANRRRCEKMLCQFDIDSVT